MGEGVPNLDKGRGTYLAWGGGTYRGRGREYLPWIGGGGSYLGWEDTYPGQDMQWTVRLFPQRTFLFQLVNNFQKD